MDSKDPGLTEIMAAVPPFHARRISSARREAVRAVWGADILKILLILYNEERRHGSASL
jgi:hypothetical protein